MIARKLGLLLLAASVLATAGCLDRDLRPLNPCTVSGVVRKVKVNNVDQVDVLFMVDNSNSMGEEQASLSTEFPNLVSILASGELPTGQACATTDECVAEGAACSGGQCITTFPPVKSLRVGVVSSDMGTGGFTVPTCSEPNFGDDGVLRTTGNTARAGCMATYPAFLTFEPTPGVPPDATAISNFAGDFTCVAAMGTGGCGFEQQLAAVLKALTPSTSSFTFAMGTVGHGDGANAGFLRQNSLLAVILVTDEDDCSAIDPELFNPTSTRYSGDLNLRCFQFREAVHPIQRYVDGLISLRSDPDLLVYGAITGVPTDLVADPDFVDFDRILEDDRMQERPDPTMPTRLEPSCNVPGRGLAFPPRRIVQVAKELDARGAAGIVQSICQENFSGALRAIIKKIADVLGGACLPRALNPDETGRVNCEVVEVLPTADTGSEFTTCASLAGLGRDATPVRYEETGAEVCRINQVVPTGGVVPAGEVGWYYDNFSADVLDRCSETPQRISFTAGAEPKTGAEIRLECLQPVTGAAGQITLGTPCADDPTLCARSALVPGMFCETTNNTCELPCETDADCPGGYVCYRDDDGDGIPPAAYCVNPTCGTN